MRLIHYTVTLCTVEKGKEKLAGSHFPAKCTHEPGEKVFEFGARDGAMTEFLWA